MPFGFGKTPEQKAALQKARSPSASPNASPRDEAPKDKDTSKRVSWKEGSPSASPPGSPKGAEESREPRVTGLNVTVISAEYLKDSPEHTPEPYCSVSLPSGKEFFKTPAVAATIDPEWNHEGNVHMVQPTDSLTFTVKDAANNDHLLGKCTLEPSQFNPMGFNEELMLHFSGRGKKAAKQAKIKIKIELLEPQERSRESIAREEAEAARLKAEADKKAAEKAARDAKIKGPWVWMIKIKYSKCIRNPVTKKDKKANAGLRQKDLLNKGMGAPIDIARGAMENHPWGSEQDLYVTCEIKGKKAKDTMMVTRVLMNAFAPEWNEEYMLRGYVPGDDLHFKLMDYEPHAPDDECMDSVDLPGSYLEDEDGFKGDLVLADAGNEHYKSVLNVEVYKLPVDEKTKAQLQKDSIASYDRMTKWKAHEDKVQIAPGQSLKPVQEKGNGVFERLYQDNADRQSKKRAEKEAHNEQKALMVEDWVAATCRTAPKAEVMAMSERLYAEGEEKKKKREDNLERLRQADEASMKTPSINPSPSGIQLPDGPRYDALFEDGYINAQKKEELRAKKQDEEDNDIFENSVHRFVEETAEDLEVWDRLYEDGAIYLQLHDQRIADQLAKEREAMFNLTRLPPDEYVAVAESSAERLHADHARRIARIEERRQKLATMERFQLTGKAEAEGKKGNAARFQMLYVDSLRRAERKRLLLDAKERREIRELEAMMLHQPATLKGQAETAIDRIFKGVYNPPSRKLKLGEGLRSDDSDAADLTPRTKKGMSPPDAGKGEAGTRARAARGKTPPPLKKSEPGKKAEATPKGSNNAPRTLQRQNTGLEHHDERHGHHGHHHHKDSHHQDPHHKDPHHKDPHHKDSHHKDPHHKDPHHKDPHHKDPHHRDPHHKDPHHKDPHHKDSHHKDPHHKDKDNASRRGSKGKGKGDASGRTRSEPTKGKDSHPGGSGARSRTPPPGSKVATISKQRPQPPKNKAEIDDRRRRADDILRQDEGTLDSHSIDGWHPAYRPSLLKHIDPKFREKVEADLDFRELMSVSPLKDRDFCQNCQNLFAPDSAFCRRCGVRRPEGRRVPEPAQPGVPPFKRLADVLNKRQVKLSTHFGKWDVHGDGRCTIMGFKKASEDLGLHYEFHELKEITSKLGRTRHGDIWIKIAELEAEVREIEPVCKASMAERLADQFSSGLIERRHSDSAITPAVRNATPSRTTNRRTITASPEDARRSMGFLDQAVQLHDEHVMQTSRPSDLSIPAVPQNFRWDGLTSSSKYFREDSESPDSTAERQLSDAARAAFGNEGEKKLLLTLEENIIAGLNDSAIDKIELTTPIPLDLKGLVEDVAAYYGLSPVVVETNNDTVTMNLLRSSASRIHPVSLASMC